MKHIAICLLALSLLLSSCSGHAYGQPPTPAPVRLPLVRTSPGEDLIVFDSDRSGNYEIYAMHTDGSDARALTHDQRYDSWWGRRSPAGDRILFYRTPRGIHDRDYSKTGLWIMNLDGSSPVELRPAGSDGWKVQGHAEWSPDGQQLVMFGGGASTQIYITSTTGQSPRQLTNRAGTNVDPSWSPDGTSIVFVGCPTAICFPQNYEVYTIAVAGAADVRRLTKDSIRDHDPYYAPDDSALAWLSQTTSGLIGVWNIRIAAADGSGVRNLTNDNNVNSKPQWSRDSSLIYFHRLERGHSNFSIFAIRPDGNGLHEITVGQPGNNEYPST